MHRFWHSALKQIKNHVIEWSMHEMVIVRVIDKNAFHPLRIAALFYGEQIFDDISI